MGLNYIHCNHAMHCPCSQYMQSMTVVQMRVKLELYGELIHVEQENIIVAEYLPILEFTPEFTHITQISQQGSLRPGSYRLTSSQVNTG